jgi:hypothetical protein
MVISLVTCDNWHIVNQVKALEYSRYDINGYHFRTMKLEVSRSLTTISNSRVVTSVEDANGVSYDYYDVFSKNY